MTAASALDIADARAALEDVRARAADGIGMLEVLVAMRDFPGRYTSRERAAWRIFTRAGAAMFAPRE